MDLETTIVGIVIILLCITPLIFLGVNTNKKSRQKVQGLLRLAAQQNCKIDQYDILDTSLIGIDHANQQVFFQSTFADSEMNEQVDLSEIQKCQLLVDKRTVPGKDGERQVTDKITLILTYSDRKRQDKSWSFFNVDQGSFFLKGELQLAEKWFKILNNAILVKPN